MSICSPDPISRPAGLPNDKNYRYFNQPIEQIPGWQPDVSQVLMHHANGGLIWKSIECVDIVTCILLESDKLKIERKKTVVLLTDNPTETCEDIPLASCEPSPSPSVSPSPSPSASPSPSPSASPSPSPSASPSPSPSASPSPSP